jgi:GNAT superfamily N-acetyltransferase
VEGQAAFLALDGGVAVGGALVTVVDGLALLTGAGVLPSHRGRGIHGALLAARLAWARDRGCDLVAAATRPAAASQRNLERAGFRCAYPKAILVGRGRPR